MFLIEQITNLKEWVNKYIGDCTDEELNDREFIASVVDRAIFHFAINSICNPEDNKDATPIERYTFDVETKNGLPSTVQLFYEESKDNEPGNDSNLLIVFYVQIMPDDFVMQLHRF